nr:uncharacterized protein LOC107442238 [Parasteatoda tepidariorum]
MPGRTSDSRKRVDHFQRRKVGSIRDNPKLMKIRQQFENASKEEDLPKANTFCELLNIDLKLSRVEGFQVRRHSEGEDSLHVNRNSVKASKFFSSPSVDEKSLVGVEALTKTLVCESNSDKFCISKGLENVSPPPLPKRGVSPATQSFLLAPTSSPKRQNLLSKEPSGKETSVQKAIELYEGMSSSSPKKNKSAKNYGSHHKIVKREETFSKRIHKRRSSFRRSKLPSDCPPAPVSQKEETSDCEEGNQNVYQTLSTFPASLDDPYDRLNRIHDVLHQIHEGQTSACAACKAIPSIKLRDSAILEVKCHEVSPHHHPPCICFSCQHSVFSCSVLQAKQEDDLYYNLCCLNLPNRESWRQSRRRPVCEQNGRLCVVNCDIEKSAKIDSSQKEYENLSNCHSMSPRQKDTAKQMNGESYESDEGWVDVTDSEDEKSSPLSERTIHPPLDDQNLSLEIVDIIAECSDLKLTDACSTEHLYESISEIESQEPVASSKDDPVPENELDSGEWSTESSSPVFNESFEKNNRQNAFSRYTVSGEETSKKTFMKSVLGKRTKKRRMSNFFVPWLVSNNEYCVTTDASNYKPSTKLSSRSSKRNLSSKETCCKNVESDKSSKMLPESPEDPPSFSSSLSRNSSVSYVRADELESVEFPKQRKTSLPGIVDVSVERVCRHSGNSEHTYILFTPIKEDQVPLYQFYERNVKERVSFCRSGSKNLSPIMWIPEASSSEAKSPQLSVVEQLSPEAADIKMLWCELPEVKESGILERISAQELKLQEGIFEFIQSQASYVRSLKVLYENFIQAPEFSSVLSKHEQDVLFSDIIHLKEVSDRILYDVTARWGDSILIPDICDIILHHAQLPSFSIYVKYCSNRVYQERTLKELKDATPAPFATN